VEVERLVEGADLVLGAWKGPEPTEHVRIPIGEGICGAAAASGLTEVVDDVGEDELVAGVVQDQTDKPPADIAGAEVDR
jgi:GAF domain-containing protein